MLQSESFDTVASRRLDNAVRRRVNDRDVPDLNIKLLRQVADLIEAEPNRHEQKTWAMRTDDNRLPTKMLEYETLAAAAEMEIGQICGTRFCFAGHAVHIVYPQARPVFLPGCAVSALVQLDPSVPKAHDYGLTAAKVLGLTVDESDMLFSAANTRRTIRYAVNALIQAEADRLGAK